MEFCVEMFDKVLYYYLGRMFAHDLANFARESLASNVRVMGPDDFLKISQSSESYFVDFFAPVSYIIHHKFYLYYYLACSIDQK